MGYSVVREKRQKSKFPFFHYSKRRVMPPNRKEKFQLQRDPFLLFLPFLVFYIIIVSVLQANGFWGDEERYYVLSQHLLHGYYSSPAPNVSFENGPGYPIAIAPFVALRLPLLYIKLLNAVLYYLSVIFLFKVLNQYVSFKITFYVCLFWACYFNAYEFMPLISVESLTVFLLTLILFLSTKAFQPAYSKKYIILSGFFLGYLALTKIVFGYVLLVLLIGSGLFWVFYKRKTNYRRAIIILALAFLTTSPYLIYTFNFTGRIFYWGTSSGTNLYWMSSPHEGEYGNWYGDLPLEKTQANKDNIKSFGGGGFNLKNRTNTIQGVNDSVTLYHQKDFDEINKYTGVERDDAFKRIALRNIKAYPMKYIKNCFSNLGRMLFNYPYSYSIQKPGTLLRIPLNGVVIFLMLFSMIPALMNWKKIPFSLRFALILTVIYLGGSVLESAEFRMFTIIVPVLLLWITFILQKCLKIQLSFVDKENQIS
jgi:4-amino-4-deoxy-L-arabinose transferase-like glycosyltransferase